MKAVIVLFFLLFGHSWFIYGNANDSLINDSYYKAAYTEILEMLQGKKELSFKRAVFVTENAFLDGQLDYNQYCKELDEIEEKLEQLIKNKGLQQYKTASQWAIFTFMTEASALNGNQSYTYDFDDFMGEEDWTNMFVTKLMRTKSGNCHSLPYFYKILANEMDAEAYIALGPEHVYIKHRDETGEWTNIEMTSGEFPQDKDIIRLLDVSIESIIRGAYLAPLTEKESVALCLWDLAMNYKSENGDDAFTMLCYDKVLEYDPNNMAAALSKASALQEMGMILEKNYKGIPTETMIQNYQKWRQADDLINELGYKEPSPESYEKWVKSVEAEKEKLGYSSTKQ